MVRVQTSILAINSWTLFFKESQSSPYKEGQTKAGKAKNRLDLDLWYVPKLMNIEYMHMENLP